MSLPSPNQLLGLENGRFSGWYPNQEHAFGQLMDWYHSPARFLGLYSPSSSAIPARYSLAASTEPTMLTR